jgi:hypothetical protein
MLKAHSKRGTPVFKAFEDNDAFGKSLRQKALALGKSAPNGDTGQIQFG